MQNIMKNHSPTYSNTAKRILSTFATCLILFSCFPSEKQPEQQKIETIKFFSFQIPGKLEHAKKSGLTCSKTIDKTSYTCIVKNIEVYGVMVDGSAILHEFGDEPRGQNKRKFQYADADMGYLAIELITRKPPIFEKECKDDNQINLVFLDGAIEKTNNDGCIEDKREVFDKALLKNGWTKTYYKGTNTYTHRDIRLVIEHALSSESFRVTMGADRQ